MTQLAINENGTIVAEATAEQIQAPAKDRVHFVPGGLKVPRRFTKAGEDVFNTVEWEIRAASITNEKGEAVFEQKDCEIPKSWSQMATNVVVSKYFRGTLGTPEREQSVRQLIGRVADTIAHWGKRQQYFLSDDDAASFRDELTYILLHQYASFNSPVWFNCGVEAKPQCSACFINSVEDTMESILTLAKTEGMLFKFGSGTGTNFSSLRSSRELLQGGGTASGPVSFMKGYDAFAGVIKSGGKTRRAAKMVILNSDHPDVVEFINCKSHEEKKAWALIDAGYDGSFNGEAYSSVFFQNSNNSVRATDAFMQAVDKDEEWQTRAVTNGEVMGTYRARDLMKQISEAAWISGDPGMQFHSTVNRWHTCPNTDEIKASNPCSEYMFLNDSACNLASLNLMKFRTADGGFDSKAFRYAVSILITAQEIIVSNASYPTERIGENSENYRPLGLGYANLGALLMSQGLAYDSDTGRHTAAAITALMTGEAYATSARIAARTGPFTGFEINREPCLRVLEMHRDALKNIDPTDLPAGLFDAAKSSWDQAIDMGRMAGIRNAQATVLAPTGTIGFMMDCDTTGVEPDIALVKYKKLVGGGLLKIVNNTVPLALEKLGYTADQVKDIAVYIDKQETIEGAPHLSDNHLPVFDCAFKAVNGERTIHTMGHVKMMAAVQPFISGAISKTVNMPTETTPEEIAETYMQAWKLGLKAIAIYRDGCKRTQPLNTGRSKSDLPQAAPAPAEVTPKDAEVVAKVVETVTATTGEAVGKPYRRRLPDEREAITHKFSVGGHEGYITVGLYEDGRPGEIFLTMAKEGSVVSGLMDCFATAISMTLQYGVPIEVLIDKFSHTRFEPSGYTANKEIPIAKSLVDYIFRYLGSKFLGPEDKRRLGIIDRSKKAKSVKTAETTDAKRTPAPQGEGNTSGSGNSVTATAQNQDAAESPSGQAIPPSTGFAFRNQEDALPCTECGSMMVRSGACYKCMNCGATSGCS